MASSLFRASRIAWLYPLALAACASGTSPSKSTVGGSGGDAGGGDGGGGAATVTSTQATSSSTTTTSASSTASGAPTSTSSTGGEGGGGGNTSAVGGSGEGASGGRGNAGGAGGGGGEGGSGGNEASGGGGASGFTSCEGSCKTIALEVTSDGVDYGFEHAFYGLVSPDQSLANRWELHMEVQKGGSADCPGEGSPTPEYAIVFTGIPVPTDTTALSSPDDATASLVDYVGDILPTQLFTFATSVTIHPVAANTCTTCTDDAPPTDPDGFVAFDAALTFEDADPPALASDHVYATHCDSMDDI
jgi:hypothetical protein